MGKRYNSTTLQKENNIMNYEPKRIQKRTLSSKTPPIPLVSCILIGINVFLFLFITLRYGETDGYFYSEFGGMYPPAVEEGEWYRFFTCMFLHANSYHLFNNMVMLFAAGAFVEEALGWVKYVILYFGSGFFASLSSYLYAKTQPGMVSIGASGAIFGVVGALLWIVLVHKGRYERLSLRGMLFMLALSLYYGFASGGTDNAAHLGGAAAGFLLSLLLYRRPSGDR